MKQIDVTVQFREGLHARPAVKLIKLANTFRSAITLEKQGEVYAANSITSILSACVVFGDKILLKAEGPDEDEAIAALQEYFS